MPLPGDRRLDREVGRRAEPHDQRPGRIDPHDLAVALELPGRHRAAGEAAAQAGMVEQVARMLAAGRARSR